MRQIKLNILPSDKILIIGGAGRCEIEKSDSLTTVLAELFPERKGYWTLRSGKLLNISFSPDIPFGPDPEMITPFLFDDFKKDLEYLIKEYNLEQISLSGLVQSRRKDVKGVIYSDKVNRKELSISAYEAKKLIEVTREGSTSDDILLSLFIKPEQVYTFIVPNNINFSFLFSSVPELKDFNIDEFIDTISGSTLSSETVIASSPIRYIGLKGWRIDNSSGVLFPAPYFNRPMKMTHMENKNGEPCCNCLACASVCPADLYPALLYHHLKEENINESTAMGLNYCSSCRKCSIVCPSGIPLSKIIIKGLKSNSGEIL